MTHKEELTLLSFKEFLAEVNYGALEKDERIAIIGSAIKNDMLKQITNDKVHGEINLEISSKTKNPRNKNISIFWFINISKVLKARHFLSRGGFSQTETKNEFVIELEFTVETTIDLKSKLLDFIDSDDIDEALLHEIKHLLNVLDSRYLRSKYQIANSSSDQKEMTKYVSQKKEIESYLISVISDIRRIKKENPNASLSDIISDNPRSKLKSDVYNDFMKHLIPSKRNKYKTKITHFWYSNYE